MTRWMAVDVDDEVHAAFVAEAIRRTAKLGRRVSLSEVHRESVTDNAGRFAKKRKPKE